MSKTKIEPPKAFVAGISSVGAKNLKRVKLQNASEAFATVKENSKKKQLDRKSYKKDWWMTYQPPESGLRIFNLTEETPWHSLLTDDVQQEAEVRKLDKARLQSLLNRVRSIFAEEVNKYERARNKSASSEGKWMDDMIKSGTFSDKVAAMALRIQESPVHQLDTLDALIYLADKSDQRAANTALEAIKDLFTHNLLPPRPLLQFEQRQLGAKNMTMGTALLYYFEDQLLDRVKRVVNVLERGLNGTLEYFKKQCMEMVMTMLASKPEQEKRLLTLLVGKLTDQTGNVASKCIELLKRLMKQHPVMKQVIIQETHDLIFRDAVSTRAVYNGIVFLSQVPLSNGESVVAALLVEGYIVIFEKAVAKEEMRARLMSGLLTGINKAFPYLKDASAVAKHTDELFRIAHGASFSSATQALILLSHIALGDFGGGDSKEEEEGEGLRTRFYRALYSKLLSDQILTRTHNTVFLNLLYRSIKRDSCEERCGAFVKRLAICATNSGANISAGLLMLVSEVLKVRPALVSMLIEAENEMDSRDNGSRECFGSYDASKREPKFAATSSLPKLWEASLMRHHAHPSVSKFSESLLQVPHVIKFLGDPTVDFTVSAFLNRFAFKNPKQRDSHKIRRTLPTPEQPLNSNTKEFLSTLESDVDADKRFFHRFFGQRSRLRLEGQSRDRSSRKKGSGLDGDEDAFGDPASSDSDDSGDGTESSLSEVGEDESQGEEDEEAEMDRYADKLAEQLMRAHANGEDPDMDDFSSDEGEDSDVIEKDEGFEGSGVEHKINTGRTSESSSEGDDIDFHHDRSVKAASVEISDSDSTSDDYSVPQIGEDLETREDNSKECDYGKYHSDSDEGEFDEPIMENMKTRKRKDGTNTTGGKRARKTDDDDTFSSYSREFEGVMSQILEEVKQREKTPLKEGESITKKGGKKGRK